jgi:hypothetical protein
LNVGSARANRERQIHQDGDTDSLEKSASECQTSVGAEVAGQLLERDAGEVWAHLQD